MERRVLPPAPNLLDAMPSSSDAEKGVLGSILLKPDVLDDVAGVCKPGDFIDVAHGRLYRTMLDIDASGQRVDALLLRDRLPNDGTDWSSLLYDLGRSVPHAASAAYYAGIVARLAKQRRLIVAASDVAEAAKAHRAIPEDVWAEGSQEIERALEGGESATLVDGPVAVGMALARTNRQDGEPQDGIGLSTGFSQFDSQIGGLYGGELAILAARPSMGKSAFGCAVMKHNALRGRRVLFCSLEMSANELATRLLCSEAGVDANLVRTDRLSTADRSDLEEASDRLGEAAFCIDARPRMTVRDIALIARRVKRQQGLSLLIVDYLGRLHPERRMQNRWEAIGEMTRSLKALAAELNIPVLCLAQVNRAVEKGSDRRPQLSHLRESGDIEQDADVVAFIHREEMFRPNDPEWRGVAELLVRKNRNGPIGEFRLAWDACTTTFSDPSPACTEWDWDDVAGAEASMQFEESFAR